MSAAAANDSKGAVAAAKKPGEMTIAAFLQTDAMQRQIAMALPKGMDPVRMTRIAITEMRRNPKLETCTRESFVASLFQCAQLGLEPGPMGLAYLIPYGREATFQIGYKGLLALAWRSGQIKSVQAEVVYQHDHFDYEMGLTPKLAHRPAAKDRGEPTHVWAVVHTTSGGSMHRVMTADEIDKHRAQYSKAGKGSPWDTSWGEMACKTVLKRVLKLAPVSAELQQAIYADDMAERGYGRDLASEIDVTPAANANARLGIETQREDVDAETGEVLGEEYDADTGERVPSQEELSNARTEL